MAVATSLAVLTDVAVHAGKTAMAGGGRGTGHLAAASAVLCCCRQESVEERRRRVRVIEWVVVRGTHLKSTVAPLQRKIGGIFFY